MVVVLIHVVVIAGLIRAFTPEFAQQVTNEVLSAFNVTISPPEPEPTPTPPPQPGAKAAGKSGEAGKKAVAKEVSVPKPKVAIRAGDAPRAASTGNASTSGAANSGAGTGAGGTGNGTGAGGSGNGAGSGGSPLAHIGGNISSARDYPKANRALRNGTAVTVQMTVGADGRARNCRVVKPSPDAEADAITCRLIEQRFRFRPKTNAAGQPIEAEYRWQQRWWNPKDGSGEN